MVAKLANLLVKELSRVVFVLGLM